MPEPDKVLKTKFDSIAAARDQMAEYIGLTPFFDLGGGFVVPNPSLLDPDQEDRHSEMQIFIEETLDRHPDTTDADGNVIKRGEVKLPWRVEGKRVDGYDRMLAKVVFGDRYQAFRDAGGRDSDVTLHWAAMNKQTAERKASDPK